MSDKIVDLHKKSKPSEKLTQEDIKHMVANYEDSVKDKVEKFYLFMKIYTDDGKRAIAMQEAVEWIDACQNILFNLFKLLKELEGEGTPKKLRNNFIDSISNNMLSLKDKDE